jgi:hypothetical protein
MKTGPENFTRARMIPRRTNKRTGDKMLKMPIQFLQREEGLERLPLSHASLIQKDERSPSLTCRNPEADQNFGSSFCERWCLAVFF